jgi:hypothetical protein
MSDTQSPRSADVVRHGACGQWWTGLSRLHCSGCCRTFSSESAADRHRVGAFGVDRRCVDPESVGLVAKLRPFGLLWSWPAPVAGFDARRVAS